MSKGNGVPSESFFERAAKAAEADLVGQEKARANERIKRAQREKQRRADAEGKSAREVAKAMEAFAATAAAGTVEAEKLTEALAKLTTTPWPVGRATPGGGVWVDETPSGFNAESRFFSPDDALKAIIKSIKKTAGGDEQNTRELVGLWIAKTTNELTALLREFDADE